MFLFILQIEWLRPNEICQKNGYPPPQMFVKVNVTLTHQGLKNEELLLLADIILGKRRKERKLNEKCRKTRQQKVKSCHPRVFRKLLSMYLPYIAQNAVLNLRRAWPFFRSK